MIEHINCRMIELVMYGVIESIVMDRLCKPFPDNALNIPNVPFEARSNRKYDVFTPGVGIPEAIWITTRIQKVINSFFLKSFFLAKAFNIF